MENGIRAVFIWDLIWERVRPFTLFDVISCCFDVLLLLL